MKFDADDIGPKQVTVKEEGDDKPAISSGTSHSREDALDVHSGVERIPDIPTDCRRDDPNHEVNRRNWVRRLKGELELAGKRLVESVRFLDDGIVYAWAFVDGSKPEPDAELLVIQKDKSGVMSDIDQSIHELEVLEISSDKIFSDEEKEEEDPHVHEDMLDDNERPEPITNEDDISSTTSDSSSEIVRLHDLVNDLESRVQNSGDNVRDAANRRENVRQNNAAEVLKLPTGEFHPVSSIDWRNYRKILILKRVPLNVSEDDIYYVLLGAGFPFARIQRILLHQSSQRHRLASVQFRELESAQSALSKLRSSDTRLPSWWQGVIFEPCEARRGVGNPSTTPSTEIRPNHEAHRISSTITRKRRRSDDEESLRDKLVSTLRRANQFYTPQRPSTQHGRNMSDGVTRNRNENTGTRELRHQQVDANTSESNSRDVSDSESYDIEYNVDDSTYAQGTGTVPFFEGLSGGRKLNESACCPMPRVQYGRPRRLAIPSNGNLPMIAITIRGDLQFIDPETRSRISQMSMPAEQPSLLRVSDARFAGNSALVAYRQVTPQISIVKFDNQRRARKFDLGSLPHGPSGASCLAPIQSDDRHLRFLTGGNDKRIHLWTYDYENPQQRATVKCLPHEHNTGVSAMAWNSLTDTLISASGHKVWTYSMKKELVGKPAEVSNKVCQVHIHPQNPQIAMLEVDHIDRQILVFDTRRAGFDQKPVFELGLREADRTYLTKSKHRKGDAYMSYFVRGYQSGIVAMWDYRNPKSPVLASNKCRGPVWHTVFSQTGTPSIWAYAEGACINFTI